MPDIGKLLWPKSVAVIGASSDTHILRGRVFEIIRSHPFAGAIYPVSRSAAEVQGLKAYPSIDALPEPVDMVWTSQNYHDLHNFPGLDVGIFNKLVFDDLKPGGIYLVLDHRAEAGSGGRDTKTLHRIDPETVKKEVQAAGFVFVAASDLLHQPGDDHSLKVFDPAVRGKTDQFILKFRKP